MDAQLSTEIADQIGHWHEQAECHATATREQAEQALQAAVNAGQYLAQIETMTRGRTLAWLRDNVPNLTPQRAKAYLSLFHTQSARECKAIDHRQLLMLGVVDKAEAIATAHARPAINAGKWIGWIGSTRGWYTKATRERPLSQWLPEERQAVRDQLRPLVEIFNELGR